MTRNQRRYGGQLPRKGKKAERWHTYQCIRLERIRAEAARQASRIIGEADDGEIHDLRIQELKKHEAFALAQWLECK